MKDSSNKKSKSSS